MWVSRFCFVSYWLLPGLFAVCFAVCRFSFALFSFFALFSGCSSAAVNAANAQKLCLAAATHPHTRDTLSTRGVWPIQTTSGIESRAKGERVMENRIGRSPQGNRSVFRFSNRQFSQSSAPQPRSARKISE